MFLRKATLTLGGQGKMLIKKPEVEVWKGRHLR